MNRNSYWSRLAITSALGVGLSYLFVFLAALPLRYLRLTFGRKAFLLSSIGSFLAIMGVGLWQWAMVYASLCLLIGFYRELEEKHVSIFLASTIAVFVTTSVNIFALLGYTHWKGIKPLNLLLEKSKPFMEQLHQVPQFKEADVSNVLWYLPSGVMITMMFILFVSLAMSRTPMSTEQRFEMRMFRLPDWLIWVFILSLAGSFIEMKWDWVPVVAKNFLAVTVAAYFFQGLAVFNYFMDRLGVFGFWRLLAHFLIFFQMFIFVSGLGILDHWFEFRNSTLNGPSKKSLKRI